MPKITIQQLDKELRSNYFRPVYLIYGPENYLIQTALKMLKKSLGVERGSDTQIDRLEGAGARWLDIENTLKTIPMWSKKKIVHISNADKIPASEQERMIEYLKSPVLDTMLILTASKADARTKLVQAVTHAGGVIECKQLYDNQIPAWINIEAKDRERQISMEAAAYLAELAGKNLSEIASALDKIILYVGDKRLIDLSDVEAVLTETTQKSVYELGNALGERSVSKAVKILENLFNFGENPVMILNMILRHWRILIKTKELINRKGKGIPDSAMLAGILKVHPYFVKDYIKQSRNFSIEDLRLAFNVFWKADRSLKSSRISKRVVLEKLLTELI